MSDVRGYYDQSYPPDILRVAWQMPTVAIADLKVTIPVPADVQADSYEVNWGDGTDDFWGATTGAATHTYEDAGTYTITVDPFGPRYPAATTSVTVTEPEPAPEETEEP